MIRLLSLSLLVIFTTFLPCGESVNLEDSFEMLCISPHPRVARNVDYEWVYSVPRWYIPLQSRLSFYRNSESLLKTPVSNFTEDQLNPSKACITFKFDNPPKLFGFGNELTYLTTNVIENTYGFNTRWPKDIRGRHYITLRDNQSYIFFATCWANGQASWALISTNRTISEELKTMAFEHAKSWGFEEEYFLETDYETCPQIPEENEGAKNEL